LKEKLKIVRESDVGEKLFTKIVFAIFFIYV